MGRDGLATLFPLLSGQHTELRVAGEPARIKDPDEGIVAGLRFEARRLVVDCLGKVDWAPGQLLHRVRVVEELDCCVSDAEGRSQDGFHSLLRNVLRAVSPRRLVLRNVAVVTLMAMPELTAADRAACRLDELTVELVRCAPWRLDVMDACRGSAAWSAQERLEKAVADLVRFAAPLAHGVAVFLPELDARVCRWWRRRIAGALELVPPAELAEFSVRSGAAP